ncbi:cell wall-binding repeat-containing protein [Clostridium ihumii]|uniref:cell wall-binding repeat-containing protein n=1 Tax=Clostridium ihumii TaxID=1470356 RepID=UPI00058FCA02|nr:cell wall-binding repeat-containing protein [Clostridium ihumii]
MKKIAKIVSSVILSIGIIANSTPTFGAVDIGTEVKKIYGKDRYETSAKVSQEGWDKANTAIIANGEGFSDALCSTPLSKAVDGPILLTTTSKLPVATKNELKRLKVNNVYISGGAGVVNKNVENEIKSMGIKVTRLGGKDRYETSIAIANELSRFVNITDVMLISGEESTQGADALSAAPLAALNNMPMLLASQKTITPNVKQWILNKNPDATYVIASDKTINDKVVNELPRVERVYGKDRYDTNLKVLQKFNFYLEYENCYVAQGTPPGTVDALTTGPLAAKKSSPLILVSDKVNSSQSQYLKGITSNGVIGVGGAVSNDILLQYSKIFDDRIATKVKALTIQDKRSIILEFDGIVKETPASDKENYEILGTTIIDAKCIDGYDKVQLTFKSDLTESKISHLEGRISNVVGENIQISFNRKNIQVTDKVTDKVKPKVSAVSVLDIVDGTGANSVKKKITVKFNEAIKEEDALDKTNFRITDKEGNILTIYRAEYSSTNPEEIHLITPSVNDTSNYKLEIKGIRDLSNNIMEPYSKTISLKDTTKPVVKHFEITNTSDENVKFVDITFSKRMDEKTATTKTNYVIKDSTGKTDANMIREIQFDTLNKDSVRIVLQNVILDGTCTMTIKGVKDTIGNVMEQYESKLVLNLNRPLIITPVPYDNPGKIGKNNFIIRIEFDRPMNEKDVKNLKNYSLVSENNVVIQMESAEYNEITKIATVTSKTLTEEGLYTLQVKGIKDSTGVEIETTKISLETGVISRPSMTKPILQDSEGRNKTIIIEFDEKMDSSSVQLVSNYMLFNSSDESDYVKIKSAKYTSTNMGGYVTLVTDEINKNGDYILNVKNLKNIAGVSILPNESLINITNIRPRVEKIIARKDEKDNYSTLNIVFSDLMDGGEKTPSNYSLTYQNEEIINVNSVKSLGSQVLLELDEPIEASVIYTLKVTGIYSGSLEMEPYEVKFRRKIEPSSDNDALIIIN